MFDIELTAVAGRGSLAILGVELFALRAQPLLDALWRPRRE